MTKNIQTASFQNNCPNDSKVFNLNVKRCLSKHCIRSNKKRLANGKCPRKYEPNSFNQKQTSRISKKSKKTKRKKR